MTVFDRTWDASYEATPGNGDAASEGAERIRDLKTDVAVRLAIDHSWDGDGNDGLHKKVTFVDTLASKPTKTNNETYLYSKVVAGTAELFYEDGDENEVLITNSGLPASEFASGTTMIFYQDSVPIGWTIDGSQGNKGIKVVSVASSGGISGGTDTFSTCFSNDKSTELHELTISQMPAHDHDAESELRVTYDTTGGNFWYSQDTSTGSGPTLTTEETGGGSGHGHDIVLDLQYIQVLIAVKD